MTKLRLGTLLAFTVALSCALSESANAQPSNPIQETNGTYWANLGTGYLSGLELRALYAV